MASQNTIPSAPLAPEHLSPVSAQADRPHTLPAQSGLLAAAPNPAKMPGRRGHHHDDDDRTCEDRDENQPRTRDDDDSDNRCAILLPHHGGMNAAGAAAEATGAAAGEAAGTTAAGVATTGGTAAGGTAAAGTAAGSMATGGISASGMAAGSAMTGTAAAGATTAGTGALGTFTAASLAAGSAVLLGGISAVASGHDGHGGGRQPSGRNETASTEPLKPAVQTPVQTVAHDGEHTLDAALFGRGVTGKSIDYVVLQRVRVRSGSTDGGTDTGADDTTSGLWLRHDDGSAPTRLAPGAIIAKADFGRVFWSAEDNAGGEFQFVASDARGVPVGGATPQIVTVQELPPVPVYPEQPVSYTVAHDQTLAIDAQALAGQNPKTAPAGGVRIDGIDASQADGSTPALYLKAEDGTLTAVTAGTVVAPADFSRLVWDSAHNDGGSFRFTALNASGEATGTPQTVTIHEAPLAPVYADDLGFKASHDAQHPVDGTLFAGQDATRRPPAVRILSLSENADKADGLSPLYIQYPGNRVFLKPGDTISAEDFDKVRWDAMNSEGGSFRFMPVDAQGADVPGWTAQTVTVREYPDYPDYPEAPPTHVVPQDAMLALPATVFAGNRPASSPAFIQISAIDATIQDGTGSPPMLKGEDGRLTPLKVGDIVPAAQFGQIRWDAGHNGGGSFEFIALDADQDPLPHLPAQVVQVHESPVAPTYAANSTVPVAHDGVASMKAQILGGTASENRPAQVRIDRISPEGDTDASRPALYIDRDGTKELLQAGSVVDRADFALVRWDAGDNDGGQFSFTALDGDGVPIVDASRQPVSQTVTVHESPEGPVYDNDTPLLVAHDQTLPIDASVLAGSDAARKPAFVQIVAIDPANPDQGASGPLSLVSAASPAGEPVRAGQTISADDFANLRWDSAHNEGGTFRFIPLDGQQQPIVGFGEQTVTVRESPLPPVYDSPRLTLDVEQNLTHALARSLFDGSDPSRAPSFVAITKVSVNDAEADHPSGLMLRYPDGSLHPLPAMPMVLSQAAINNLVWDARHNTGGKFTFVALDSAYLPLLGADDQVIRRTITINEPALAPDYPASREALNTAHDAVVTLNPSLFTGDTENKAPAKIRITALQVDEHRTPETPALQIDADGKGGTVPTALNTGDTIDAADFAKLSWNTVGNKGGSFTFVPLDSKGNEIPGAVAQTITIHEDQLPAPQYDDPAAPIVTPHDQDVALQADTFIGTIPGNAPPKIRITAIDALNDAGQSTTTGNTLQIDRDGPGGEAPVQVSVGQLIDRADFDKLSWNATGNAGGSFSFEQVDANGELIPTTRVQTVTVHESPVAPTYAGEGSTVNTAWNWAHPFARVPDIENRLLGTDAAHRPAYLMVTEVNPVNQTSQAESQAPLTLRHEAQGSTPARTVVIPGAGADSTQAKAEQSIIAAGDVSKLYWNGKFNDGGFFTVVALDADKVPILGADGKPVTQTIHVNELPHSPQYEVNGSNAVSLRVPHDYNSFVLKPALFSGEASEHVPAQVRIDGFAVAGTIPLQLLPATGLYLMKDGVRTNLKQGDTIQAADYDKVRWDSTQNDGNIRIRFTALDEHGAEILKNPDTTAHRYLDIREDAFDLQLNDTVFPFQYNAHAHLSSGARGPRFWGNGEHHVASIRIDKIDAINAKPGSAALRQGQSLNDPAVNEGDILYPNSQKFLLYWHGAYNDGGSFRFTPLDAQGNTFIDHDGNEISRVITAYESAPRPSYVPPAEAHFSVTPGQDQKIEPRFVMGKNAAIKPMAIRFQDFTENGDTDPGQSPVYVLRNGQKVYLAKGDRVLESEYDSLYWDAHHNQGGTFTFYGLDGRDEIIFNTLPQTVTVNATQPAPAAGGKSLTVAGNALQLDDLVNGQHASQGEPAAQTGERAGQTSPQAGTTPLHAADLTTGQAAAHAGTSAGATGAAGMNTASATPATQNLWHGTGPLQDELQHLPLV